ncbi:l-allo-threonine aldolase [Hypoxylon sp. FL0890]|nr:l-allo-threonine aldolase [Hypoxylon sp. FL0890]
MSNLEVGTSTQLPHVPKAGYTESWLGNVHVTPEEFNIASRAAWNKSGQAAYDFRSDYVTTPNAAMLLSIVHTSLLDEVMMEDPTTNSFQGFMAKLTGHENSLLVLSGTMGNQVALRTALSFPPYGILCDSRRVKPSNNHHLTLEDVKRHVTLRDDVYDCPTRVISLENTLSGTIMPLQDVRAISNWARSLKPPIHTHLDGARLWEAVAAGAGSLRDHASYFDSLSLCFTKGLGAPIESVVIGSGAFIKRARLMRKMLGGGLRQAGVIAAPARVAVEQIFLGGHLCTAQETPKRVSEHPTEINMIWLDPEAARIDEEHFAHMAEKAWLKTMRGRLQGRLVVHYQIYERALQYLEHLFIEMLGEKRHKEPLGGT